VNGSGIACSLDAAGRAERASLFAALAEQALRERRRTARGWRLEYRDAAGVEDSLRRLIAAEAECCPFLRFGLERSGDRWAVTVEGPADAQGLIEALLDPQPAAGG
jgi:hypothetical protein